MGLTSPALAKSGAEPFSIVLLPDTQWYTTASRAGKPQFFTAQTEWIAQNKEGLQIELVLQLGDLTDDNGDASWSNASRSLAVLDGVVPYVLAVGNHDGLSGANPDTAKFNQTFPQSRFAATLGGVFEPGKMDNSFHCLQAGGVDLLVLSLEFGPRDSVLVWANQVVEQHPAHRVIVVTHAHLYGDDTLQGSDPAHRWTPTSLGRENDAPQVWDKFLRKHENIAMVFSGHNFDDGQGRLVGTGDHGNKVLQVLCNFQGEPGGGNGFLQVIRLFPAEDRLEAFTYSPVLDEEMTDSQSSYRYAGLGIFDPPAFLADTSYSPMLQNRKKT
jgi:hypothetical protein